MTPSPAFLQEINRQVQLARHEIELAATHGDESDVLVASARLAELDDLIRRATEDALTGTPSWA